MLQAHLLLSLHHAKSHEGSGTGIVSLMNMLIEDMGDGIRKGIKDEARTQKEFEADMKTVET